MNGSNIKIFSFLPSDYDCIEKYLEEKLADGYRLKWIKGGFAGFIKNDIPSLRYVVDPYPNTNFLTLKRMPKIRLDMYTENGWYFLAKTRGNYIFFTDKEDAEFPNLEPNAKEKTVAAETKRNGLIIAILAFIVYQCLTSKAFMYTYVLTNMYIYLSVILGFLGIISVSAIFIYSKEKLLLASKSYTPSSKDGISRGKLYTIRNFGVIILAFAFYFFETRNNPIMLLMLAVPVAIMITAAFVLKKIADKDPENASKKITPVAFIFGGVIMLFILFSLFGMQKINTSAADKALQESLAKAGSLPVVHYSDVFDGNDFLSRSKENNSLLGNNYLFSEADSDGNNVFTNYTETKNSFAANKIFNYLYSQAQTDYNGEFVPVETENAEVSAYKIDGKYAYLIKKGNTITLFTVSENADKKDIEKIATDLINK